MKFFRPVTGIPLFALVLASGCGHQSTSGIQGEVDFLDQADLFRQPIRGAAPAFDPAATIALVDGTPIPREEFEREVQFRMLNLQQQVPADQLQQLAPRVQEEALEMLIIRRLLDGAVRAEQITVPPERIEDALATLRTSVEQSLAWDEFLDKQNITETAVRARLATQLQTETLLNKRVPEPPPPTDRDVQTFYEENTERFQRPELAGVSHLLLAVDPEADEAEWDLAAKKAAKLREAAVDKGVAFETIVERYSEDEPTQARNGVIGIVRRGQLPPELDEAAFSIGVGEISPPLRSDFGIHLLRVDSREEARALELEEVSDTIRKGLQDRARQEAVQAYIKSLVQQADVVLPTRRAAPPESP